MNVDEYTVPFFVVVGVAALLVASPALSRVLVYPRTEFFTELWVLGPNRMAEDYPFNISRNENYDVYLGIGNHLGYCGYYLVEVKFRNATQSPPDSLNRTASSQPALFNISAFVGDESFWEMPVSFSFDYDHFDPGNASSPIVFYNLTLNDVVLDLGGYNTAWNSTRNMFYGDLMFELWLFKSVADGFVYHERFVDLKLNMTTY